MNKKKLIFKSNNIFGSLKDLYFADKKIFLILFVLSFIISGFLSIYFEKQKFTSLEITFSYNDTGDDLTGLQIISPQSFNMYVYENEYVENLLPRGSMNFPSFRFKIFGEEDIKLYEKRVEDVLTSYKNYLADKLQKKIEFVNDDDDELKSTDLKYTLYALTNSPIFYDKKINILKPDIIFVTFLKIYLLIFLTSLFLRFTYLFMKKKIIIK